MKVRFMLSIVLMLLVLILCIPSSHAHFGMMLPSDDVISSSDSKQVVISLQFLHPFNGDFTNMSRPSAFGVVDAGAKTDLLSTLEKKIVDGFTTWQAAYRIGRPGDKIFFVEPAPYWEPSEGIFIIHYTKLVVGALGLENQWDKEVGLKTEIVPLTRPYGLWAGNVFQGIVRVDRKPHIGADVEVEYFNKDRAIKAPDETYTTQVVKTDNSGVFTYAMPRAGWWGFAALSRADFKLTHKGKKYPVELGAVLWVRTREMR